MNIFLVGAAAFMSDASSYIKSGEYYCNTDDIAIACPDGFSDTRAMNDMAGRLRFDSSTGRSRLEHSSLPEGFSIVGKYYPARGFVQGRLQALTLSSFDSPKEALQYPDARGTIMVLNGEFPREDSMVKLTNPSLTSHTTNPPIKFTGCAGCGFPGHNSRTCTKTKVYDKIGIEIEGRFADRFALRNLVESAGASCCGDGSIGPSLDGETSLSTQEVQTKPGTLTEALRQLVRFYPDQADYTCGMHVHVSFLSDTHITQLYSQQFFEYFRAKWLAWADEKQLPVWHSLRRRLSGENSYCRKNVERAPDYLSAEFGRDFNPVTDEDRYMQLNFTAWGEHKTVECRLLPMFRESELAVEAVTYLINIFQDWITTDCEALNPEFPTVSEPTPIPELASDHQVVVMDEELSESFEFRLSNEIGLALPEPPPEGFRRVFLDEPNRSALSILGVGLAHAA